MHGDICRDGGFLHRRRGDLPAATAWAVGLRDYGSDFDIRLSEELDESRDGEMRGAAENQAQAHGASTDVGESVRSFDRKNIAEKPKRHDKCAERQGPEESTPK
jgi:hypothetical protein